MMNFKHMGMIILSLVAVLVFTGCCAKQEPVVVHETIEVEVPVKPKRPDIECKFEGVTYKEKVGNLLECIGVQKRAIIELTRP